MQRTERTAERVNLVASLWGHGWSALGHLGFRGAIGAGLLAILTAVWTFVVRATSDLPLWALGIISLAGFVLLATLLFLCVRLFVEGKRALALHGVKKLSLAEAADLCLTVERRYHEFLRANRQALEELSKLQYRNGDPAEDWPRARAHEDILCREMRIWMGGDVAAAVGALGQLGIQANSDMRSLHWADQMSRYFGAVGRLLNRGLLAEAKGLDVRSLVF